MLFLPAIENHWNICVPVDKGELLLFFYPFQSISATMLFALDRDPLLDVRPIRARYSLVPWHTGGVADVRHVCVCVIRITSPACVWSGSVSSDLHAFGPDPYHQSCMCLARLRIISPACVWPGAETPELVCDWQRKRMIRRPLGDSRHDLFK